MEIYYIYLFLLLGLTKMVNLITLLVIKKIVYHQRRLPLRHRVILKIVVTRIINANNDVQFKQLLNQAESYSMYDRNQFFTFQYAIIDFNSE